MKVGNYAMVTAVPEAWEGAGESSEELRAYVGHVGLVVEVGGDYVHLRFPLLSAENETAQRSFMPKELTLLACPTFVHPNTENRRDCPVCNGLGSLDEPHLPGGECHVCQGTGFEDGGNKCHHDWQELPGEPPVDVCSSCGLTRG